MEVLFNMELSAHKSERRKGTVNKNLEVKNKRGSLKATNPDEIMQKSVSNGIIETEYVADDDVVYYPGVVGTKLFDNSLNLNSDTNTTNNLTLMRQRNERKSSKCKTDVDITSCKPCSVILERLTEKEVHHLLRRNNLDVRNVKKNNTKKYRPVSSKSHNSVKAIDKRNTNFKKLNDNRNSKKTVRKKSSNSIAKQKHSKVESSSCLNKTIQSNVESNTDFSSQRINKSCLLSYAGEVCFGSERISSEDSEKKVSLPKSFRLTQKKKIANTKDNDACRQDSDTEIFRNESSEQLNKAEINSEGTKNALSLLKQLKLTLTKKMAGTEEAESCSQDPGSKTLQTEGSNEIESSGSNAKNSESKVSMPKCFKLSLGRTRTNTKDDEACRQDSTNKISQAKDSDEIFESNVLNVNHFKHSFKRKLGNTENNGASGHKLTKFEKKQGVTSHDRIEVDETDKLLHESSASRHTDQQDPLKNSRILGNRSYKQKVGFKVRNKVPIVKNVRVSLVKLERVATPSTFKQIDNVKTLDQCVDEHESSLDYHTNISETQPKDVHNNCFNKTRNTKITDYFFKVDRRSIVSENNSKIFNKGHTDLLLNKKYGICKDAIVLLIDLKNIKIPASKYSASEIQNLTQEYANSSTNINFLSTIANMLPSFSDSPVKNLPHSYNELSTNNKQSSTYDYKNPVSIHNHVNESSYGISKTFTVSTATNLSPKDHKSLQLEKHSPVKRIQDPANDEQSCGHFINPLSVHAQVHKLSHGSLNTSTVPISVNLLPIVHKSSQVNKHSLTKNRQLSLNNNLSVNRATLGSRKEKESLKNIEHVKDYSLGNEDLAVDEEVPDKDTCQSSSNLSAELQSSLENVRKLGTDSSDSWINNAMPKLSKTLDSHIRELALSSQKHIVLINDEIKSNQPQACVTDNNKSLETNEVQEKSDAISHIDILEVLHDSNKFKKISDDSSVLNKDSNTVICQPDAYPVLVPVIKSPIKVGNSRNYLKLSRPRHLPVNSMTILSREMIEENSSWISLNNTTDNITKSSTTPTKNHTIEENESFSNLSIDNTTYKTRTSCNTTKDVDNNFFGNTNLVGTIENRENASFIGDNKNVAQFQDKMPNLRNLLNAKNTECFFSKHPTSKNIETCSSEVNALTSSGTTQKKDDHIQCSDSVLEIETPMLNIPSLGPIPPVEDSVHPMSVEYSNQDCEDSSAQDKFLTDLQQEGQLLIDTDESDSDSQPGEGILPNTSPSNCSHNSTSLPDKEACKNIEVSPRKECIICKKTYRSTTGLENHLKVHINRTDSCCLLCDKPLTKKNVIEHYLEHCGCSEDGQVGLYSCVICKMKFRKKSGLTSHLRFKHNVGKNRIQSKLSSTNVDHNKCNVCQLTCNSEEDLFTHVLKHTSQELQDAFRTAMAKKQMHSITTSNCENEGSNTPEKEETQNKEHISSELTEATDTSPTSPPAMQTFEVSICMCHKSERLEISGGVIIEIALACIQCKTFFKTRKCFKDHYNSTSCKWTDDTLISPKMFCNKCCVILNNLEEMHEHLTKHGEINIDMKTSLLCKHCNIFFFGIGSLFYTHWSEHRNNPLFLADHYSFPKNMKVKIVEPRGLEAAEEDEPTESLFIADHQCHSCEKPFQTEIDLKKHFNSSNFCSKKVDSAPQVIENPRSIFNLICSICNKEFKDKLTFNFHIAEHDTIKDFLQALRDLDKSLENNQLTCSICKTEYDTITNYKDHLTRHAVIQEKFVCNYCTLMMDSVEDFERHSTEHKGTPEKPVACKVIFATAKFHCKPCKIWFDNQCILDEHLARHNNFLASSPSSVENSTTKIVPIIEKKSYICATCQQVFDDQLKLDAHVSTHNKDSSDRSTLDPIVIHLSDDSNSADAGIIATKTNEESSKPVVENALLQKQQKTANIQKTKKPAFLRVKNLKELLPYDCSQCKSEFDTQINLSKHVCIQHVNFAQDKQFNYFCKICKNYPCDNDSDWNLHVLSHFPVRSFQSFSDTWYHILKMGSGQQVFKCNMCPIYQCLTIHMMRHHFILSHPDIYHPIFTCRVCHNFKTKDEQEILQHETTHFQKPLSIQLSTNSGNNLSSAQPVDISNRFQQSVSTPPVTSSGNNISMLQPVENLIYSQQLDSITPIINLSNNLSAVQLANNSNNFHQTVLNPSATTLGNNLPSFQLLQNFTDSQQSGPILKSGSSNNVQQPVSIPPVTSLGNNLSLLRTLQNLNNFQQASPIRQPDNNSNNLQQSISIPPATSLGSNFSTLQPAINSHKLQEPVPIPVVSSSGNNLPSHQPLQNFKNSQQFCPTRKPDNNSNDFQQSILNPPVTNSNSMLLPLQPINNSKSFRHSVWVPPIINSVDNIPSLEPLQTSNNPQQPVSTLQPDSNRNKQVDNSNKFQQPVSISPLTTSANNLHSHQPLANFTNSQQSTPTRQPYKNFNNFQQSISIPSVTSSESNLSSLQTTDNPQWLATATQTFQIQINNATPFPNMTNVMQTVPLYVTNMMYCCRICKSYKCSSEQELKVHEALHEFIQLGDPSKRSYQCKVCPHIFFPTEDKLRTHMEMYHKADKSKVSQNNTQSDVTDTQVKCKHCLQTFTSFDQLTQHIYSSHTFVNQQQTDIQLQNSYSYSCQLCSIDFLNEAFLHAHIRQKHPILKLPRPKLNDTKTLYQCDACGLLLISEVTLNYHMRSHNLGLH